MNILKLIVEFCNVHMKLSQFGRLAHRIIARMNQSSREIVDVSLEIVDDTLKSSNFGPQFGNFADAKLMLNRSDFSEKSFA
ncbi:MAG: hypothetical protein EBY93_06245 [Actinobacteria bacterium]|nr:hypothetical protein [Actinomycetota bacterium]